MLERKNCIRMKVKYLYIVNITISKNIYNGKGNIAMNKTAADICYGQSMVKAGRISYEFFERNHRDRIKNN